MVCVKQQKQKTTTTTYIGVILFNNKRKLTEQTEINSIIHNISEICIYKSR